MFSLASFVLALIAPCSHGALQISIDGYTLCIVALVLMPHIPLVLMPYIPLVLMPHIPLVPCVQVLPTGCNASCSHYQWSKWGMGRWARWECGSEGWAVDAVRKVGEGGVTQSRDKHAFIASGDQGANHPLPMPTIMQVYPPLRDWMARYLQPVSE